MLPATGYRLPAMPATSCPTRRSRARSHNERVPQGHRCRRVHFVAARQNPQQQPHRAFADLAHRLCDGRQRRMRVTREPDVVEPDDRKIARHMKGPLSRQFDHSHRHFVVEAEDRRRRVGASEQPFRGGQPLIRSRNLPARRCTDVRLSLVSRATSRRRAGRGSAD